MNNQELYAKIQAGFENMVMLNILKKWLTGVLNADYNVPEKKAEVK